MKKLILLATFTFMLGLAVPVGVVMLYKADMLKLPGEMPAIDGSAPAQIQASAAQPQN